VVDEFCRHVIERRILSRNFNGNLEHVLAEERHPGRAIGLLEMPAGGKR